MKHKRIDNKVILISGGVGSIGGTITDYLLTHYSPKTIRIFDNNEEKLFYSSQKYSKDSRVRIMLGDIRDKDRLNWAVKGVDTVFHAAALKHVTLNEYNTFEAVKTNVIGTQNLIETSLANDVEIMINISTDKAVDPISVMGVTKLLSEKLISSAKHYKGNVNTIFLSVRFGNVLNSSGSIIPILISQLKNNLPITLTDKRMVRYFMTLEEAIQLILKASTISIGGEVFILKMPTIKIVDLVEAMVEEYEKRFHSEKKHNIIEIGKRSGEKLTEELLSVQEMENVFETDDMYIIPGNNDLSPMNLQSIQEIQKYYTHNCNAKIYQKNSHRNESLSKSDIRSIVRNLNLFKDTIT